MTVTDFFSQVSAQIGFALERADLLEERKKSEQEQRNAKEQLQRRALELLMEGQERDEGFNSDSSFLGTKQTNCQPADFHVFVSVPRNEKRHSNA